MRTASKACVCGKRLGPAQLAWWLALAVLRTLFLVAPVLSVAAQCRVLIRADYAGLWISTPQGVLVRRLTDEWVSHASWSPDGTYIGCTYWNSDLGLMTSQGKVLSRIPREQPNVNVELTGIGLAESDVLWLRLSGHASSVYSFLKLPQSRDLKRAAGLGGAFGDDCAIAPDLTVIACVEAGRVALVQAGQNGLKDQTIYPATFLDPANQVTTVNLVTERTVRTRTNPAFELRISAAHDGLILLRVTPPSGNWSEGYLKGNGDFVSVELEGAVWMFAPSAVNPMRTQFRVATFKDDSQRELSGICWDRSDRSGSRLLTTETSRRGGALLTLSRTGEPWAVKRMPIHLPGRRITARRFDPDGSSVIVESLTDIFPPPTSALGVYRCTLDDRPVCRSVMAVPGSLLVRLPSQTTIQASVLDWHCSPDQSKPGGPRRDR